MGNNMKNFREWLKKSISSLWDGVMKNVGVIASAFIFSGGYLVVINTMEKVSDWINSIPTVWIFTPFLFLLVVSIVLIRIAYSQRLKPTKLEQLPMLEGAEQDFITHYGVWWRIHHDSNYIEDFPYCACCDNRRKLVQIEWYPDEVYKCSSTGTTFKLFDGVPRKRSDVITQLVDAYFRDSGLNLMKFLTDEANRIKDLNPKITEKEILDKLFKQTPLSRVPESDRRDILERYSKSGDVCWFFERHYPKYRRYLEVPKNQKIDQNNDSKFCL